MKWPLHININRVEREKVRFDIQLLCVLEGEILLKAEGQEIGLKKDDIFIINSGQQYSWIAKHSEPMVAVTEIDYKMLLEHTKKNMISFWCNSAAEHRVHYDELRKQIYLLVREYAIDPDRMSFMAQGIYYQMIDFLMEAFMVKSNLERTTDSKEDMIYQIVQYINGNFEKKISLEETADIFFVNAAFLSRIFKEKMKINFTEYVNAVRMEHVIQELLFTEKSITVIAYDNGYTNVSLFNRTFKKKYQKSPTAFRKEMKGEANDSASRRRTKERERLRLFVDTKEQERQKEGDICEEYTVDVLKRGEKVRYGCEAVYIGPARTVLQSNVQKHILVLREELGIRYLQIKNVLSSEMELRDSADVAQLNFEKVDTVFDFITEQDLTPVIELGEEARKIYRTMEHVILRQDTDTFILSEEDGRKVVSAFLEHVIRRYGYREVSGWLFCLSYDPEAEGDTSYQYARIVENSFRILKNQLPDCLFGVWGQEVSVRDYKILSCLEQWKQREVMPDFIMIQALPYQEEDGRYKYIPYPEYTRNKIQEARKLLDRNGFKESALYLNRWNSFLSDRNYINETAAKAAITVQNMIVCAKESDRMIYDYGSDLVSVSGDQFSFLTGGKGLLTKDGLRKPVCFALGFLGKMNGEQLLAEDGILAVRGTGEEYYILIWNPGRFSYKYFLKREDEWKKEEVADVFEKQGEKKITIRLSGLAEETYCVRRYQIDDESVNLIRAWEAFGNTENMMRDEIRYLKDTMVPRLSVEYIQPAKKYADLKLCVKINEVTLLHLFPRERNVQKN